MEEFRFISKDVYDKKNLSYTAKLKHYITLVRPVILFCTEALHLTNFEKLLKVDRSMGNNGPMVQIIKKIHGPRRRDEWYSLKYNEEIYQNQEDLRNSDKEKKVKFLEACDQVVHKQIK